MKSWKTVFILLAVFLLLPVIITFPACAQQKYNLKFNHVLGVKEPYHQGFTDWAKAVSAKTKGGLKIDVFHSAQLGVEEDIIEQIRQGANVGQNTDSARLGNYVPGIAVMNGPYFATTLEEVIKIKQTPTVKAWTEELANKFGLKVLSFTWVQGYRHFFTNKPIRKPEDLKGMRIRTPPAPIWQESVRALGATPVAMAFGDMYPALQQKAIEGVELVYNNIPAGRFYEVLKYANETGHIMLINFEVISAKFFNGLPGRLPEDPRRGVRQGRSGNLQADSRLREGGQEAVARQGDGGGGGLRYCRFQEGRGEGLRGPEDLRRESQGL